VRSNARSVALLVTIVETVLMLPADVVTFVDIPKLLALNPSSVLDAAVQVTSERNVRLLSRVLISLPYALFSNIALFLVR
jgi:hypothetical protein